MVAFLLPGTAGRKESSMMSEGKTIGQLMEEMRQRQERRIITVMDIWTSSVLRRTPGT